jgi:hypothetical protein
VSSRNQIVEQVDGRLRDLRLIEEFDHQGQIDGEPKQVIRMNLPIGPKAGDASEDGDPLHGMPVVQKREDLSHQGFAPSVIRFAQIDPDHEYIVRHRLLQIYRFRAT